MSHEIYVKFSVNDTERFDDWLENGIDRHSGGYDAFYTLVKDGVASRYFDRHLDIEAREAVAIAEAIRIVNGVDNDDVTIKSSVSSPTDCDALSVLLSHTNSSDIDSPPYRNEVLTETETVSNSNTDRISASLNALYLE